MNYDAILLAAFGGPEGPEDVIPFLERVTAGRGIPRERLAEVGTHYSAMGGVSPINEQNRNLLAAVRTELASREIDLPIYWGNRNSKPFFADALKSMHDDGHRSVLALATSAYASYSGCRQYRENLAQALAETGLADSMKIDKVRHYFDHPGFIEPFVRGLVAALTAMESKGLNFDDIHLFFTTHSIPNSMAETSGPPSMRSEFPEGAYVAQHKAVIAAVLESAERQTNRPLPKWSLVYQSRSGAPHTPWLEPDIGDALASASTNGVKAAIVIPIGFISDHVEVIWDLDTVAKRICDGVGLEYIRVATPGLAKEFVSGIVDLIEERIGEGARRALSALGPWPDICAAGCCSNPRSDLPTVAGE
ncbi:ferrochelatase [mine drainage metagenome]|uniref:Ferrochelatase n=1 Tax=mine drainage metagenome TaxID=410659 RepID=A0A1J5QL11_9ZZZZ